METDHSFHIFLCTIFFVTAGAGAEEYSNWQDPMIAKSHKSYFNLPAHHHGDRQKREIIYNGTVVSFSAQEKIDVLNRHLELRSQVSPEAANMEYMVSF